MILIRHESDSFFICCFYPPNIVSSNWRLNFLSFSPGTHTDVSISMASESVLLLDEESSDSIGSAWKLVSTCLWDLPFLTPPAFTDCERKETKILEAKYVESQWVFPQPHECLLQNVLNHAHCTSVLSLPQKIWQDLTMTYRPYL